MKKEMKKEMEKEMEKERFLIVFFLIAIFLVEIRGMYIVLAV